jgi:hypothetical protein
MDGSVFPNDDNTILEQIRNGMHVYDSENKQIGTVDRVFLGEATALEEEEGTGPAGELHDPATPSDEVTDLLAKAFGTPELADVVRERLLENGFVQVKAGLLGGERYILPNQIADVSGGHVKLNVKQDELIKR